MPLPVVIGAVLANPKAILLFNLLLSRAIRAIWIKVANMSPEEIDQEIIKQEEIKDELMAEIDSH